MRALLIQDLFTNVIALRYVSISRFVLKAWFRHRSSAQRYSVRVGIQLEVGNLSAGRLHMVVIQVLKLMPNISHYIRARSELFTFL